MAETGNPIERLADLRARWEADRRSRIFLQLAEEYRRQGQPLEALAILDEGLGRHPSSVAGKVLQGRCRLESGQAEAAAATLEEVVARDPTHIVAYRWLTESYLELEDAERGRRRLEVYTQLNPQGEDLPDLSRRLVALEDPARRVSVGSGRASGVTPPPRPSAEVTEAPTMLLSVPPGLRGSEPPEIEERAGVVRPVDRPNAPESGEGAAASALPIASPTEAPTRAIPLTEVEDATVGTSWPEKRPASTDAAAETTGDDAPASSRPGDPLSDEGGRAAPAGREASTAKLRLASLGLIPDEESTDAVMGGSEEASGLAAGRPETEQVTAEIPWWRARPAPKPATTPWDTQETEARPLEPGEDLRPLDERPPEERRDELAPLASEAPTGIFDASQFRPPSASEGDEEHGDGTEAETATVQLAGLDLLRSQEEADDHSEESGSELDVARAREEPFAAAAEPARPSSVGPPGSEESDLFDSIGGGEGGAGVLPPPLSPLHRVSHGAFRRTSEPRVGEVFDLSGADQDRAGTAHGGPWTSTARPPFSDPFPELYSPADHAAGPSEVEPAEVEPAESRSADSTPAGHDGNGSADLFALDPGGLLDEIDLASIPTRPLSIPFWLAHPAAARPSRPDGPATPTLAHLYLQQGHAVEAETIYGTILEHEPENQTAREGLAEVGRVRADLSAAALIGDYEPERGGLTAKQVYLLQRYLARLRGERGHADVS